MVPLRLLLADDHELFRKGLVGILSAQPNISVVGEASDGLEAIELARQTMPDLILMDLSMPKCDGLQATQVISQEMPHVQIVMLTASDDDASLFAALKSGANGYLLKTLKPSRLLDVLGRIQEGECPISGSLASRVLNEFRKPVRDVSDAAVVSDASALSARDREVLEWVAKGASNKEIGDALCITENTVKLHIKNILTKLHLQNRIQAAVYAVQQGWVKPPMPPSS